MIRKIKIVLLLFIIFILLNNINNNIFAVESIDPAITINEPGNNFTISTSSNGIDHILYYDPIKKDLIYTYWNGYDWHNFTLDSEGDVGMYPSLFIDKDDILHASYFDATNNKIKYAKLLDYRWHIEYVDNCINFTHNIIQVSSTGQPIICYNYNNLKFAYKINDIWEYEDITTKISYEFSFIIDNNYDRHVVFLESNKIFYKYYGLNSSHNYLIKTEDKEINELFLTVDNHNVPYCIYYLKNGSVIKKGYEMDKENWVFKEIRLNKLIGNIFLLFDCDNYPIILYYDQEIESLKMIKWNGIIWIESIIVDVKDNIKYFDLIKNNLGEIHIVYLNILYQFVFFIIV